MNQKYQKPDKDPRNKMERYLTKKAFTKRWAIWKSKEAIHDEWGRRLGKRRDKRIVRLMKLSGIIANTPRHFVTLAVDRKQRPFDSAKEELKVFDKFKRSMMRKYPNSRFVSKVEYKGGIHLHFHMIGTLSRTLGRRYSPERAERLVKKLWDAANGFTWKKSTKIKPFIEGRSYGYITDPKKRDDDMHCVELLGSGHMVGLIGKKNIRWHEKSKARLTDVEKAGFFEALKDYLQQQGRGSHWLNRMRVSSAGNFVSIPQDLAREILENVTSKTWKPCDDSPSTR